MAATVRVIADTLQLDDVDAQLHRARFDRDQKPVERNGTGADTASRWGTQTYTVTGRRRSLRLPVTVAGARRRGRFSPDGVVDLRMADGLALDFQLR